jgi:DNA-binding MltR family transcriptional regulator
MAKHRRTPAEVEVGFGHEGIQIADALNSETDRGCALVAAEFISDALELCLRRGMERKQGTQEEIREFLTNLNAPLGNLGPRIKAAYWFDKIGKNTYEALEHVREIRNKCAHRAGPIDFTDSELTAYVRGLSNYLAKLQELDSGHAETVHFMLDVPEKPMPKDFSPQRLTFIKAAAWLYLTIRIQAVNPQPLHPFLVGTIYDAL